MGEHIVSVCKVACTEVSRIGQQHVIGVLYVDLPSAVWCAGISAVKAAVSGGTTSMPLPVAVSAACSRAEHSNNQRSNNM